jgi:hypothetical protein
MVRNTAGCVLAALSDALRQNPTKLVPIRKYRGTYGFVLKYCKLIRNAESNTLYTLRYKLLLVSDACLQFEICTNELTSTTFTGL